MILEESHDVRYRKRNSRGLEEPPGLGSRILRRLSSKTKDQTVSGAGIDNRGFQKDAPNSPWRYPFRRANQQHQQQPQQSVHPLGIQRTASQDSTSSISSNAMTSPMHKVALSRILP